jgi:hypothetical protein
LKIVTTITGGLVLTIALSTAASATPIQYLASGPGGLAVAGYESIHAPNRDSCNLQFGSFAQSNLGLETCYDSGRTVHARMAASGSETTDPGAGDFASMDVGLINLRGPDIPREVTAIQRPGMHNTIFGAALALAPEKGSMMLLGAGFLSLAIYGKRRKNAFPV